MFSFGRDQANDPLIPLNSDYYLAWQIQALEYNNLYSFRKTPTFSTKNGSAPPINYKFSLQGQMISFALRPTAADGDCFFHAVGKPGLDRKALVDKLYTHRQDLSVRAIFSLEIRQFLYIGCSGGGFNQKEDAACQELLERNKEFRELLKILQEAELGLQSVIVEVRAELGEQETNGKQLNELLFLLQRQFKSEVHHWH